MSYTKEKVVELVVDLLDRYSDQDKVVKLTDRLSEDIGMDSLDVAEFQSSLEDLFNIEIPESELTNIKTVGQVVDYIKENT